MKNQPLNELKAAIREAGAVRRGKTAPKKVWRLTRLADGGVKREQMDPEVYRRRQSARWDARQEVASARTALGVTHAQFASLLGISLRTLHQWELGRRNPSSTARVLLHVAQREPQVLKRLLATA
ncbi:MAG: helix-turn-helix domain-containing protein [Verrucomicrobiaceae bacterium]|nr:helix-turn-helix domain-containing protein [Verrucomicrobiaceae bacterium]